MTPRSKDTVKTVKSQASRASAPSSPRAAVPMPYDTPCRSLRRPRCREELGVPQPTCVASASCRAAALEGGTAALFQRLHGAHAPPVGFRFLECAPWKTLLWKK